MNFEIYTKLSYGVYVITSSLNEKMYGCVANCAMQITDQPSTIAISMNHNNETHKAISESGYFAINVLQENIDPSFIGVFGFSSSKDKDKFKDFEYEIKNHVPVLRQTLGYLTLKVINTMETPMTYKYYHEVIKGKSPKNAPTHIVDENVSTKEQWVCSICGYVYDGEIPFEQLPDDYKCPLCLQPKEVFEKR